MGKRDLIIYVALKYTEGLQNARKVFHYKYFTVKTSINFSALQLNQSTLLWLEKLTISSMLLLEVTKVINFPWKFLCPSHCFHIISRFS